MTEFPKPFFFAWVNSTEAFDPAVHNRKDESIFKFDVDHSEGDFATLTIVIKNPKIGLLAPARKVWAWLSWLDETNTLVPLFFGRLVGIPTDINLQYVTLLFTARAEDFITQKVAFAETLKVRPYYDPIWISPTSLSDPDTVLEARSQLWSIDRVTLAIGVSDVLVGEDGDVDFLSSDVPYDSVSIRLGQTPLRSVTIDATANWTQQASGSMTFGFTVPTYTGGALMSGWPKSGSNLQGGWSVISASIVDLYNVDLVQVISSSASYQNNEKHHAYGDTMSINISASRPLFRGGSAIEGQMSGKAVSGVLDPFSDPPVNVAAHMESSTLYVPLWLIQASMTLQYDAARARKEHAQFTLTTNVQSIITHVQSIDPSAGDVDTQVVKISSVDVGLPVAGEDPPIFDLGRRSYFPTDRGQASLEYLIYLARAHLLIRSRVVDITFACRFERAIALTLRKNARLFDNRLPGHQAIGKIINYKFGVDGTTGVAIGSVTIGCAIGYGGAFTDSAGEPTYVSSGYVTPNYQAYTNHIVVLPAGDVTYTVPIDAPNDDGLTFPLVKRHAVVTEKIHGSADEQAAIVVASFPADVEVASAHPMTIAEQDAIVALGTQTTAEVLKTNSVWFELELKPVNSGPFENTYPITVSDLEVPKMIDLEASV